MYERILRAVAGSIWAIMPAKLDAILAVLELRAAGGRISDEEMRAVVGAAQRPVQRQQGTVAVLPLHGTIAQRMGGLSESSGGTSTTSFTRLFRQAMDDPQIGAIVIDVDSPGGSVYGVQELAAEIYAARGQGKPIVAVASALAASAAYWIASAADELSVTPSGEVGSIGVIAVHQDASGAHEQRGVKNTLIAAGKHKGEFNSYGPLSAEDRAALQASVDTYYADFVSAVARQRGVPTAAVRGGYGEGRVVGAQEAKRLGMVDRIETLDAAIARMMRRRSTSAGGGLRGDTSETEVLATDTPPPVDMGVADTDLDRRRRRVRLHEVGAC